MEILDHFQGKEKFDEFESLIIKMKNFGISETSLTLDKSWIDLISKILKHHFDINVLLINNDMLDIKKYSKFKYRGVYITFVSK